MNRVLLRNPAALLRLISREGIRVVRKRIAAAVAAPPAEPLIDVKELISRSSLEELNRKAEEYFSSLSRWDDHLAKPYSRAADAPALLINFATMIQGMDLAPGARVLDFGAGTGWTARALTQLGCEVVLLDVSPTALDIARELYRRNPVAGARPEPAFLVYDGRRIGLPDASVDRILCFDAFHHATDPDATLAEFARVLRPGGIAAFAEPGPEHSTSPYSQHEMRTYGVVENDVDVHAIWRRAREVGFQSIRFAAYNIVPFHVSLDDYDDLLRGGATYLRWAEKTRAFMKDARNFFLRREGEERLDSRRAEGLTARIEASPTADAIRAGERIPLRARVTNAGKAVWLPSGAVPGGVSLGCHLSETGGKSLNFNFHWEALSDPPREIRPGETVELDFALAPLAPGGYELELDCVSDGVCWFHEVGSPTVRMRLEVR